jgi:hypothetical protein
MPEALTESFCERCGTRYEFKAPTRLNPLRKTRGLVSGLRNYIMSQDALSDAVGDAMRSEEESLSAQQLEAFHESFNFCIDCRQYTCVNCWNHEAGRCRACAPIPGTDDLLERFEASFQAQHPDRVQSNAAVAEPSTNGAGVNGDAWPTTDLPATASPGHAALDWPEAELIGTADHSVPAEHDTHVVFTPPQAFEPEPQPTEAEVEAEPPEATFEEPVHGTDADWAQPVAEAEPEWTQAVAEPAAEPEWPPVPEQLEAIVEPDAAEAPRVVAWETDAAFELLPDETPMLESVAETFRADADFEAIQDAEPEVVAAVPSEPELIAEADLQPEVAAAVEPEPEVVAETELPPEVVAQGEPEPEAVAAVEPEPEVVAEAAARPEPEPEPAHTPLRPITDTILRLPRREPITDEPRVAAEADDPAVAARRAQLDLLGLGDPGEGPVAAAPRTVLPYRSSGASAAAAGGQAAARMAAGGSFWDASAREVASAMSQIGVQNCGQCGLSLSASARFCRRCGTRQARSA